MAIHGLLPCGTAAFTSTTTRSLHERLSISTLPREHLPAVACRPRSFLRDLRAHAHASDRNALSRTGSDLLVDPGVGGGGPRVELALGEPEGNLVLGGFDRVRTVAEKRGGQRNTTVRRTTLAIRV